MIFINLTEDQNVDVDSLDIIFYKSIFGKINIQNSVISAIRFWQGIANRKSKLMFINCQ